jgi:hypothetical protein
MVNNYTEYNTHQVIKMEKIKNVYMNILALVIGGILTGISTYFLTPSSKIGVDVVMMGTPLAVVSRVIPTRFTAFHLGNFLADMLFWGVLAYIVILTISYMWMRRGHSMSHQHT